VNAIAPSPANRNNKKAVKILRNLSQDLLRVKPELSTPSTWLLRCLVESHFTAPLPRDWYKTIHCTLTDIKLCTQQSNHRTHTFVAFNGIRPLSPNQEHFTLEDLSVFTGELLLYIEKFFLSGNLLDSTHI
jgi:hypothetical protein